jgi:hypothetical protein
MAVNMKPPAGVAPGPAADRCSAKRLNGNIHTPRSARRQELPPAAGRVRAVADLHGDAWQSLGAVTHRIVDGLAVQQ